MSLPHAPAVPAPPLPRTLAQLTEEAFLEVLYRDGASSRAAIAKITGISKPTISEAAQRLIATGVIVEVGQATGNRGRSPLLYDLNADHGHCIGVVLERGYVAARALDHMGATICELRSDTSDEDLPTAVAAARILLARCGEQAGTPRLATAVSVAAPVDPATHIVRQLPNAPFAGTVADLGAALGLETDELVVVDNDVNWAALAENRTGATVGVDDFLYVYLGAGVGAGLFLNGQVHRGASGTAGEIAFLRMPDGHTLMHRLAHSPIGACDHTAVDLDRAHRLLDTTGPLDPDLDAVLDDLARAIVNIATTVDPGRIVLGGPLARAARVGGDLATRIRGAALTDVTITVSALGRTAPLDGTGIAALELARLHRTSHVR